MIFYITVLKKKVKIIPNYFLIVSLNKLIEVIQLIYIDFDCK